MKTKFKTVALNQNQHLILAFQTSIVEFFCKGYTDNRRDKSLDGYYFIKELIKK